MSLAETIAGTTLGGFIAGIVGFLIARYERLQRRKDKHLREHKRNFEAIQESLAELKTQVWPLTAKGAENLALPRWKEPQMTRRLSNYSVTDYKRYEPIGESAFNTRFRLISIDKVLYSDMSNHFSDIADQLQHIQAMVRIDGVKLDGLTFSVVDSVYKSMTSSNLPVLKWTFDQGKPASLREIASKDTNESQGYAGYLFLMVIGEDRANWPLGHGELERYGLAEGLQTLADQIRKQSETVVLDMLRLRQRILDKIDDCLDAMERQKHKSSLTGRCEYV